MKLFFRSTNIQTLKTLRLYSFHWWENLNTNKRKSLTLPLTAKCASSQIYRWRSFPKAPRNHSCEWCKFYHLFKLKMCLKVEVRLQTTIWISFWKVQIMFVLGVLFSSCNRICTSFKILPFGSVAEFTRKIFCIYFPIFILGCYSCSFNFFVCKCTYYTLKIKSKTQMQSMFVFGRGFLVTDIFTMRILTETIKMYIAKNIGSIIWCFFARSLYRIYIRTMAQMRVFVCVWWKVYIFSFVGVKNNTQKPTRSFHRKCK